MKYFLDTEFIEGFKKPIKWLPTIGNFNKPYHSIQLISIGIVADDGREYYAISNEFNSEDANDWVKENVLKPMFTNMAINERYCKQYHPQLLTDKNLLRWQGKSTKQIACEILMFVFDHNGIRLKSWDGFLDDFYRGMLTFEPEQCGEKRPEFYAYYADYDWVVFCSMFGTMMDLPKGFPMYCRDLKQMIDVRAEKVDVSNAIKGVETFEQKLDFLKKHPDYPKQQNEHNALDDAKWNFKLYEFLKTL